MHIMQIKHVRLHPKAENEITKKQYNSIESWLKQWNPQAAIEAVIGENEAECLKVLRNDLDNLIRYRYTSDSMSHLFQFQVSDQVVKGGRFWMPSSLIWGQWHDLA